MISVRCYSHLHQRTGYGQAALGLARALSRAGVELELRTIGPHDSDWSPRERVDLSRGTIENPDVIVIHTLPGDCSRVLELEGLRRGAGAKLIAYSTWEALTAPEAIVRPLFDNFDQVWVPSRANAAAMDPAPQGRSPPYVIPHCFDEDVARPTSQAAPVDGPFRFYWIGAWTARKNPGGLIRAFALAFQPRERVELVIHSPGCSMDAFVAALAATGLQQDELPTITLSNKFLGVDSLLRLHADADCFVTAARGEAWNLPAFDAMLAGRHIISQYGLGSDDYLNDTSADLIDGWESPAQVDVLFARAENGCVSMRTTGAQGLSSRSLWLEPNLSSLASAMRSAFGDRQRTIDIRYDVAGRFGYAAVAKLALNVLENL